MTSWFRIAFTWWLGHFAVSRLYEGTLHFDEIRLRFKMANITHALPGLLADFTTKRVVVSRLHDTVAKFPTGVKFSPRYNNGSELTPGWLAPAWHFVVVSCKQIHSHGRESEWTRAGAKVAPASCKHLILRSGNRPFWTCWTIKRRLISSV